MEAPPATAAETTLPATNTAVNPSPTAPTTPPTATVSAIPPSPSPEPVIDALPIDLSIDAADIYLYPAPDIYAGDLVTFQVLASVPDNVLAEKVTVHIFVDDQELVSGTLGARNLAGDAVGLFEWVWDTTDTIGEVDISVVLDLHDMIQIGDEDPTNNEAIVTAVILDPDQLPRNEINAAWVSAEINCCLVHVISGTAAYRDLSELLPVVERAFQQAADRLTEPIARKYDVYLIDRVIGQGGYAGSSMVVSYLDRQYASDGLYEVMVHEAVHLIDRQFAPQRITFLAEGLAVWASGGHYKQEDLDQRAAALMELGRYVPLPQLIDNFYPVQHEIGYLESAAFIKYLIDKYGWPQFRAFYSDVTFDDANTLSAAVDMNMQAYFGLTLAEAEANWHAYLANLPRDRTAVIDLQTTLRYYDTMRDYQRKYDPTAYFLTAWLPYPQELQASGNPADFTRNPNEEINVALEVMLQAADAAIRSADFNAANVLLDSIERVLENDGLFIDPLATNYLLVVRTAAAEGYEAHRVSLNGNRATVLATPLNTTHLTELEMALRGREWTLLE